MARKTVDNKAGKVTLYDWIRGEINFFEGFDYADTIVLIGEAMFNKFKREMISRNETLTIKGIPVIVVDGMTDGIVQLTTRFNAEKMGLL